MDWDFINRMETGFTENLRNRTYTLVEFFESNHVGIFSECLSGHIESVFLDKTNSFLSVDTTMSVTLAGGILSFMCEPNVFVAHISSLKRKHYSLEISFTCMPKKV